ncbi:MarR family winged helix-turn-helix transcriptional regulator [Mammaliicoccus sciuri]|uniref:MarR family winged helix-turn-helix transcriptional regulator n=1 Tax=Mammaliicoccus sciuri TaxID=1296 RepID=UPI001561C54A|nr:MarR family transcriptional regulator [Mammaliicoccus sciuri]
MVIKEDSQFKLEFRNTILTFNHNVDLLVKKTANNYGYSSKACNLIYFIKLHDGLTLNELSNKLNDDKGNLSRLIKELIDLGFLDKKREGDDKRKTYIYITSKGEDMINEIKDECSKNIDELLDIYTDTEIDVFINLMKKLDTHIVHLLKE